MQSTIQRSNSSSSNSSSNYTSDISSITDGPMLAAVWHLSWPLLLNMMVLSVSNFVEGWVAGRLGPDVQAAVGLGSQIWFFMMMMTLALSAGTTALVSRSWGAGNVREALTVARQALLFALIFGIISTTIGLAFARDILRWFGASTAVSQQAWQYLQFTILSMTPYTVLWISNSIFRARGDSRTPMNTMVLVTALIIVLELLLCLTPIPGRSGNGPNCTSAIGIAGIGISWIIASSVGIWVNFRHMLKSELADCLNVRLFLAEGVSVIWLKRFLHIGLPACMQDLSLIGSSFGVFYILSLNQNALVNQAAWAAGWRVEEVLTIMPMYGLSMAAATLVGQNLGAQRIGRAKLSGWAVTAFGAILTSIIGLVMYYCSYDLARLMSDDSSVVSTCAIYLRVVSFSEPLFACWLILSGAMQGAAYTRAPMISTISSFNVLRLALAWVLSVTLGLGTNGTWLAMCISSVAAGISMVWQWQKEHWLTSTKFSQY